MGITYVMWLALSVCREGVGCEQLSIIHGYLFVLVTIATKGSIMLGRRRHHASMTFHGLRHIETRLILSGTSVYSAEVKCARKESPRRYLESQQDSWIYLL